MQGVELGHDEAMKFFLSRLSFVLVSLQIRSNGDYLRSKTIEILEL